jgi:hypothetical protein
MEQLQKSLAPEKGYQGPMDVVRKLNAQAAELDLWALQAGDIGGEDAELLSVIVEEIRAQHPLIDQDVSVTGTVLSLAMNSEREVFSLTTSPNGTDIRPGVEPVSTKGLYRGLTTRLAYDPVRETIDTRVTHAIQFDYLERWDESFHFDMKRLITYVCAFGSNMKPILPLNFHDASYIRRDYQLLEEIDKFSYDFDKDAYDRIRMATHLTDHVLEEKEFRQSQDWNMCRVSYLNSLKLLEGHVLYTNDIAIANSREAYLNESEETAVSKGDEYLALQAVLFDMLPSYERFASRGILFGGPPTVMALAKNSDGRNIYIPMKSVVDIQPVRD